RDAGTTSRLDPVLRRDLRSRIGDIAISTIDAFCLSLIREFPLEADVDPGFELADDTELPRLIDEAIDSALRMGRHLARTEVDVAMLFVQLGERRLRPGLASLLERRLVVDDVLRGMLASGPRDLTTAAACQRAARRLRDSLESAPHGLVRLIETGPLGH